MPDQNGNTVKRIDMANHFAELAAEHRITVKFTLADPNQGAYFARRDSRMISTRPIRNTGFYISALHEIGHIVGPDQGGSRLKAEWGAWRWAKENAIVWTDTAERVMKRALTSYCTDRLVRDMPEEFFNWVNFPPLDGTNLLNAPEPSDPLGDHHGRNE